MTSEERDRLARDCLARGGEALAAAEALLGRQFLGSAVNRCYYAMFYAASALAIRDGQTLHKHRAVISFIQREYVKSGRISQELGQSLATCFDRRTQADYDLTAHFGTDEVAHLLEQARRFVAEVARLLQE
jgi:uncharacterized protein (UPF0332 family)